MLFANGPIEKSVSYDVFDDFSKQIPRENSEIPKWNNTFSSPMIFPKNLSFNGIDLNVNKHTWGRKGRERS